MHSVTPDKTDSAGSDMDSRTLWQYSANGGTYCHGSDPDATGH
jgi:hypothetical protein